MSIPLASQSLAERLEAFKRDLISNTLAEACGVDESIFVPSPHLHFTVAMLKLYSEERRQLACQVSKLVNVADFPSL